MSKYEQLCDDVYEQALSDWYPEIDVEATVNRFAHALRTDHPDMSEKTFNGVLSAFRRGFADAAADWNTSKG